ncbi:MAG: DUF421 domain-containing protein [Verrucomicrobiaceae bacterium]|nr:MAG: DUF421 domain-containing protein [Verrucomicrobiaceae bacterium]
MALTIWEQFQILLGFGVDFENLSIVQASFRTIVVYAITLALVRLGSKRLLGKHSAFDVVVGIMLGSIMSRAINGSAPLLLTIVTGMVLLGVHWLFAILAYRTKWFGPIIKGRRIILIKDGKPQRRGMRAANITTHDLREAMRRQTSHTEPGRFRRAYLERDGKFSFIPNRPEKRDPRVCIISVENGVQTVRIEID